jgi:hypothetical protein
MSSDFRHWIALRYLAIFRLLGGLRQKLAIANLVTQNNGRRAEAA